MKDENVFTHRLLWVGIIISLFSAIWSDEPLKWILSACLAYTLGRRFNLMKPTKIVGSRLIPPDNYLNFLNLRKKK